MNRTSMRFSRGAVGRRADELDVVARGPVADAGVFEAAVTTAVRDVYGHARKHTTELARLFAQELGHAPEVLTIHQAAYTLTAYDPFGLDDSDGHFRWRAEQLRRNTVFSTPAS